MIRLCVPAAGARPQRRDERSDRALHVDRAAAVEQAATHFGLERAAGPASARRHDIEMAGKAKCGRLRPRTASRFSTGPSGRLADDEAIDMEAKRDQRGFEYVEYAALRGVTLSQAISALVSATTSGNLVSASMERALPKLDLDSIPQTNATGYPPPHSEKVQGRWYRRLAPPSGL